MGLDVYLEGPEEDIVCRCDCGYQHTRRNRATVYHANITHNLNRMADEAGIYQCLWRPEEIGITKAAQLIQPLREGLAMMKADPARFEQYNAPNGWGRYVHFVRWIEQYLQACEENPDADVSASR